MAIDEAKKYIDQHGYVNINWFIRQKLNLKVKNSFINSVSSHLTNSGKYRSERIGKVEQKITFDPLGISKQKYDFRTFWLPVIGIVTGILIAAVTIYFTVFYKK